MVPLFFNNQISKDANCKINGLGIYVSKYRLNIFYKRYNIYRKSKSINFKKIKFKNKFIF